MSFQNKNATVFCSFVMSIIINFTLCYFIFFYKIEHTLSNDNEQDKTDSYHGVSPPLVNRSEGTFVR